MRSMLFGSLGALAASAPFSIGSIIVLDQTRYVIASSYAPACQGEEPRRESSEPGLFSETISTSLACEAGSAIVSIQQRSHVGSDGLFAQSISNVLVSPAGHVHMRFSGYSLYEVRFEIDSPGQYRLVMRGLAFMSEAQRPNSIRNGPYSQVAFTGGSENLFIQVLPEQLAGPARDEATTYLHLEPGEYGIVATSELPSDIYVYTPDLIQASAGFSLELSHITCTGDVDGSGTVDIADLALVMQNFGRNAQNFGDGPDLTGDGQIDIEDLSILLSNFGTICPK